MSGTSNIIAADDLVLITGATGFIGARLVERLLAHGLRNIRCFARPSSNTGRLEAVIATRGKDCQARIEVTTGNLLSRDDCARAVKDVSVVFHLAAARGEKSIPDAFMNSVVTTRNLLEACAGHTRLCRFVSVSSFSVYANRGNPGGRLLDERAPVEQAAAVRNDAYCFAKVKQDEIVAEVAGTGGHSVRRRSTRLCLRRGEREDHGTRRHRHVRDLHAHGWLESDSVHVHRQLRRGHCARRARSGHRRGSLQRRGRRPAIEPEVSAALQEEMYAASVRSTCRTR